MFMHVHTWWRHQMENISALLAICAGISPVPGEFPAQRSVTRSFDVFFVLRLNKRLSKQSWGWWLETLSCPLWRHCNDIHIQLTETKVICRLAGISALSEASIIGRGQNCRINYWWEWVGDGGGYVFRANAVDGIYACRFKHEDVMT